MKLYFTSEISDCLDVSDTRMALKTCLRLICNEGVQFQMKRKQILADVVTRSVDEVELGHFTLLF